MGADAADTVPAEAADGLGVVAAAAGSDQQQQEQEQELQASEGFLAASRTDATLQG